MELKQLKELMAAMERTGTKRVSIKREGVEVEVERDAQAVMTYDEPLFATNEASLFKQEAAQQKARSAFLKHEGAPPLTNEEAAKASSAKSNDLFVTSPMVGTFYTRPAPDEPPFTKIGAAIETQSVVCIIEAMKVMNEIKAQVSGTVAEILVKEGEPVEFGTKLFRITPAS